MSYDLYLVDPVTRETIELDDPHQLRGGTYALGGTTQARLNITYNYAPHFRRVFPPIPAPREHAPEWLKEEFGKEGSHYYRKPIVGIRTLYGLTGAESLPLIDAAIAMLGDDVHEDYWKPTEGNAKSALTKLRALALLRPDGIWDGD